MEVIDGQRFSSRPTKALEVTINSHTNRVIFNVISSPRNLVIIGLSWFVFHNPQLDWIMRSVHFKTPKHKALKGEGFSNIHNNNHDGICHATKTEHENGYKQKLKQKKTSMI